MPAQQKQGACDRLPRVEVPETDRPSVNEAYGAAIATRKVLAATQPRNEPEGGACFALNLYYSNLPGRFKEARLCVLAKLGLFRKDSPQAQAGAAQDSVDGHTTEPGDNDSMEGMTLAMVYGNGEGVQRNLPLAEQLVCQYGGGIGSDSQDELLGKFNDIVSHGRHFDVCQNAGNYGRSADFDCLLIRSDKLELRIRAQERAVAAAGDPQVKGAFAALRAAWQEFDNAAGDMDGAECGFGTGCGVQTMQTGVDRQQRWLDNLESIRRGVAPAMSWKGASYARLDAELNRSYRAVMQDAKAGLRDPEAAKAERVADRAWLKYREAWVRFGGARWPEVEADRWRAWQTVAWSGLLPAR